MKKNNKIAIWVLTRNGFENALQLREAFKDVTLFVSESIGDVREGEGIRRFARLKEGIQNSFGDYSGHVFFMATGIVVRLISGLLDSKLTDPAVVVLDDKGINAISLVSGHVGEANKLTIEVANVLGANPVITTATDVNRLPSIDVFALENNLVIENPEAIKHVNMAILKDENISVYDPYGYLNDDFQYGKLVYDEPKKLNGPSVYIDYIEMDLPEGVLILRPRLLSAGVGCNRGTDFEEIYGLFVKVFKENHLSLKSLRNLASIDLKNDEVGILKAGETFDLPIIFYNKDELVDIEGIKNPSLMVEKHTGVKSVCEATAIKAAKMGTLIVPKNKTKNVTLAVAKSSI